MKKHPLIIYFKDTVAEQVAIKLCSQVDLVGVESTKEAIESVVRAIGSFHGTLIIALGQYSGRDDRQLRLECMCNKKWRNTVLGKYAKTKISPVLHETTWLKYAYGHGNSYCNLLSLLTINTFPAVAYNFIHIPKGFSIGTAAAEIDRQITNAR